MAQENTAEVTEVTQAQPDLTQLQATIAKLTTDLDAAKSEAKSHQAYGRKTKEELDKQRGLEDKVSKMDTGLQVVTEMLADLIDKQVDETTDEPPKKRRSEEYLKKLQPPPTVSPQQQEFARVASEADGLIKSIGLDMETSPELERAFMWFSVGNAQKGLAEVKKVVASKETPVVKTETVDIKKAIEEGIQAELKRRGLLTSDDGSPGGQYTTPQQAMRDYIAGKITSDEARKKGVNFD